MTWQRSILATLAVVLCGSMLYLSFGATPGSDRIAASKEDPTRTPPGNITQREAPSDHASQESVPQLIAYFHDDGTNALPRVAKQARSLADGRGVAFRGVAIPSIDSPRRAEIVQITVELEALGIEDLPAVALIDSDGKVVRVIQNWSSDLAATPGQLTALLAAQVTRDDAFAQADQSQGIERAQALHRGLEAVGSVWSRAYLDEAQEIVRLDPDNAAGLAEHYLPTLVEIQIDRFVQDQVYPLIDLGQYNEAAKSIASLRATLPITNEQDQMLLGFEGQLLANAGDLPGATQALQQCIAVDPQSETASKIRSYLATLQ